MVASYSVIVVDNVVRAGAILDAASDDARIHGTRRLFEALAREPRVNATAIQTVGSKGYDGFVLARVVSTT
jgi:predicted O-methyltransferase YrrM